MPVTTDSGPTVGVGMVGYAFMGRAHSQAWRNVGAFFDLPVRPTMVALAGRSFERASEAAHRMGWDSVETDWRKLIQREDVHIVDICTPGDSHAEIAIAALDAGKHVLCEKPLANTVEEAVAMTEAAERARPGARAMVGFNYRRVPAIALARTLVAEGRLGTIRHIRAQYLQDWIVDPDFPLVWRMDKDKAGSGALGDIGAHIIDAVQFVTGDKLVGVCALLETFVKERPLAEDSAGLGASSSGGALGPVTVDDAALFIGRTAGGALASFEATRFATGRKNALRLEINGSAGSLAFDLESMNELSFYDGAEPPQVAGFRRILVTEPDHHPYVGAWWPAGHMLGYEHTFTHEVQDFVEAIATGADPAPSFADGLQVQRVLAAVARSSEARGTWTDVDG